MELKIQFFTEDLYNRNLSEILAVLPYSTQLFIEAVKQELEKLETKPKTLLYEISLENDTLNQNVKGYITMIVMMVKVGQSFILEDVIMKR